MNFSYYINVTQYGTYYFNSSFSKNSSCQFLETYSIKGIIENVNSNTLNTFFLYNQSNSSTNITLCPGVYKVRIQLFNRISMTTSYNNYNLGGWPYAFYWPGGPDPSGSCYPLFSLSNSAHTWYCNGTFGNCGIQSAASWGYGAIKMLTNAAPINYKSLSTINGCAFTKPIPSSESMLNPIFSPASGKRMLFSAWVKEDCTSPCYKTDFTNTNIEIWSGATNIGAAAGINGVKRVGNIIEGWQKIEGEFTIQNGATTAEIRFINSNAAPMYVDDIRMQPYNANVKSYVYDPINLRLVAELDANNYASFYEYDEEGTLIRTKAETKEGIKTIKETRSAKQKNITTVVQ
jgi:hypothetical protein